MTSPTGRTSPNNQLSHVPTVPREPRSQPVTEKVTSAATPALQNAATLALQNLEGLSAFPPPLMTRVVSLDSSLDDEGMGVRQNTVGGGQSLRKNPPSDDFPT